MSCRLHCHGSLLVVGHNFVQQLQQHWDGMGDLRGHVVEMLGVRGAKAERFEENLVGVDLTKFCVIYVELGTNDLCTRSCNQVVSDLMSFIAWLAEHAPAAKIVVGEILYRAKIGGKEWWDMFNEKVDQVNRQLTLQAGPNFRFWKHARCHGIVKLLDDGIHLNGRGMHQYHGSVRRALLHMVRRLSSVFLLPVCQCLAM